jgi:Domain of unknown function (DUF4263)
LNYSYEPLLRATGKEIVIVGGIITTNQSPYLTMMNGADVQIRDVRFEQAEGIHGYPLYKTFVWFFSHPDLNSLAIERAKSEAFDNFYNYLQTLIFKTWKSFDFKSRISSPTLSYLLEALQMLKQSYNDLITRQDLSEEMLQQYLEDHFLLLSTKRTVILKKRQIGPYMPDFCLEYEDKTSTLVEIQLNRDGLLSGGKASAGLLEGINQLRSWFTWIKNNEPSKLSTTDGLLIIGRRQRYDDNRQEIDKLLESIGHKVMLLTYDDLITKLDEVITFNSKF